LAVSLQLPGKCTKSAKRPSFNRARKTVLTTGHIA
jgi:hypothetical protein